MEIELKKEDLLLIGEEVMPHNGNVMIAMFGLNSVGMTWEREILIRNVLKLFGEQYKVIGMSGWDPAEDKEEVSPIKITYFETNLPWSMIEEYLDDDEFHF